MQDGTNGVSARASVTVRSDHETPPSAIGDLVYNGKDQALVTAGGAVSGTLEYRLGEDGEWSDTVPTARDAGSYTVFYRLKGRSEAEGSAEVVIGKRPVTVSGADMTSKAGDPLEEPAYTVSGIVEGETLDGVEVSLDAAMDGSRPGTCLIRVSVNGENPNYAVTVHPGCYTVTEGDLRVSAQDKYGVFSDELTYKGFNIDLTATPSNITPYYSLTTELTRENYETAGYTAQTLKDLPAGAGTHVVYYYVTDGQEAVRGSKRVIIEKAQQKAPENLVTRAESYLNSGDGIISGLVPRKMEYRRADNDGTYTTAYLEQEYVRPGIYLVRMIGDDNHYPSPDCVLTVPEGSGITVTFVQSPEDDTVLSVAGGLQAGDLVARPEDPVWEGHAFLGWFHGEEPFDFSKPVTMSIYLTAHWDESPVHVHSLHLVRAAAPTCTEAGNTAYYVCSACGLWFEDATGLVEITDRASVIIDAAGHEWDDGIVTKEATYTQEGIRTYTCLRDSSHTRTEIIPKRKKPSAGGVGKADQSSSSRGSSLTGSGSTSVGSASYDSAWTHDASGWHYLEAGTEIRNDWRLLMYNGLPYWYYFDNAGIMQTGWLDWNDRRFYLYPVSDGWMGRMLTGWQQIDGKWYFFESASGKDQGRMYRSERTPDGYYVGADGIWDGTPADTGR